MYLYVLHTVLLNSRTLANVIISSVWSKGLILCYRIYTTGEILLDKELALCQGLG